MARYVEISQQVLDGDGNPIAGAKLVFREPGGGALKTVYSDSALTVPHTNPVIADSDGRYASIFTDGFYHVQQQDNTGTAGLPDGAVIWTKDNVSSGADDLENAINTTNIAALRLIDGNTEIKKAFVNGYYTAGDGGGGEFYWDATSTDTDNGGTIIQATGITTGRWKRLYNGAVNVKWFGAKTGLGENNTSKIQACFDYVLSIADSNEKINSVSSNGNIIIDFAGSVFETTGKLTLNNALHIKFANGGIKAGATFSTSDYIFEIAEITHCENIIIDNMLFDCNNRAKGAIAAEDFYRLTIKDCHIYRFESNGIFTGDISTGLANDLAHEMHVIDCDIVEIPAGDTGHGDSSARSATGIFSGNADNILRGNTIFWCHKGIDINKGGAQVLGNHIYNGPNTPTAINNTDNICIEVQQNSANTIITDNYIDNGNIVVNWFTSVQIVDNMFLTTATDASFHFIILKPFSTPIWPRNFIINENTFKSGSVSLTAGIYEDTTSGSITLMKDSYIKGNTSDKASGFTVDLISTEVYGSEAVTAAATFQIDRSADLIGDLTNGTVLLTLEKTSPALPISISSLSGTDNTIVNGTTDGTTFTGSVRYLLSTTEPK